MSPSHITLALRALLLALVPVAVVLACRAPRAPSPREPDPILLTYDQAQAACVNLAHMRMQTGELPPTAALASSRACRALVRERYAPVLGLDGGSDE